MKPRMALLNLGTHHGTQWPLQEDQAPLEIKLPVGVKGIAYVSEGEPMPKVTDIYIEVYQLIGPSPFHHNMYYYEYEKVERW